MKNFVMPEIEVLNLEVVDVTTSVVDNCPNEGAEDEF